MKLKNIFISAGLALTLGVGALLGLGAEKETKVAKADSSTATIYVAVNKSTINNYANFALKVNYQILHNGAWKTATMTSTYDKTTYLGKEVFVATMDLSWEGVNQLQLQIYDGSSHKWQRSYNSAYDKVNFDNKVFFVDDSNPWATKQSYSAPDSYFYYATDTASDSGTANHIYTFNNFTQVDGQFGAWGEWGGSGVHDVGTDVHGTVNFKGFASSGIRRVYKIFFNSGSDDKIIFSYNGGPNSGKPNGSQSKTLDLVSGALYWWGSENGVCSPIDGEAFELILAIEAKRNAVRATIDDEPTGFLDYSICGVNPADAAELYNTYYDADSDVQNAINGSYTYTYKRDDFSEPDNVCFVYIMESLKKIAVDGKQTVKGTVKALPFISEQSNMLPVVIVTLLSALMAGGYFFLRRRKED